MARDPRFIAGIYNYCDGWCERCPLTSRCLVFARNQADGEPASDEDVARQVAQHLEDTLTMVQEAAAEHGVDLSPAPDASRIAEERAADELVHEHPLVKAAFKYAEMAHAWVAAQNAGVTRQRDTAGARSSRAHEAGPQLSKDEAVQVIRWFQVPIAAKISRALGQQLRQAEIPVEDPVQNDANGSAKAALIGIERSLDAWFELLYFMPRTDGIVAMLEHLNTLRQDVEAAFPDARRFVRPGFDTNDGPWPEEEKDGGSS